MKNLLFPLFFALLASFAQCQQPVLARPADLNKNNYGLFCGYRFDWSDAMDTSLNTPSLLTSCDYDSLARLLRCPDFWQHNRSFPLDYLRQQFSAAADSLHLNGMGKLAMVYRVISSSFSDYHQNQKTLLSAFVLMDEWAADAQVFLGYVRQDSLDKWTLLGRNYQPETPMYIGFDFLNGNWQLHDSERLQVLPTCPHYNHPSPLDYQKMLLSGNTEPHFTQQKIKQHQVSFSFGGNDYKIRYKTDSSYISYLQSLPYLPESESRAAYPLSVLCKKTLGESLEPILKQWKSDQEKMLFLQAFANEITQQKPNDTPSNMRFAECILHQKGDGKGNAAILADCLYRNFVL